LNKLSVAVPSLADQSIQQKFFRSKAMTRSTRLIFLLLSFLAIAWHSSSAGGVLKVEGKNTVVVPVAVEVRTDVRDQIATTVLRATFTNRTGASAKMAYLFPMGLNAAVTQFRWLQNGVWTGAAFHFSI
jgi:hypothetical protein